MDVERLMAEDVRDLIAVMVRKAYRTKDSADSASLAMRACLDLFAKDYKYSVADNENGELCNSYPNKIVLLEYERPGPDGSDVTVEPLHDMVRLRELITKARFARCWTRFVVPVILYEGKHICRSATISSGTEIYGRSSFDLFFTGGESVPSEQVGKIQPSVITRQLCDRVRTQDIKLLEEFGVRSVCDLMVEARKVKYMVSITSSEKVDKERRYSRFSLWSMPYPGCEFFREWHDRDYAGEESFFKWEQAYVNSTLDLPIGETWFEDLDVSWENYKRWNIVRLTQNYMKILLKFVQDGDTGLLIHCISGWDRTPLFVSLLRLSLWADGLVHKSLSAWQILFLTIAYDWYLFGHNLPDRLAKGEEIFFFCFYFLKYMQDDDYVVTRRRCCRAMSVNSLSAHDSHNVTCSSWSSLYSSTPVESANGEWQDDGLLTLEEELHNTSSNGRADGQHRSGGQFYVDASVSDPNLGEADGMAAAAGRDDSSCRCSAETRLGCCSSSGGCGGREAGGMATSDARSAARGCTAEVCDTDEARQWQVASCGDLMLGAAAATGGAAAVPHSRGCSSPLAVPASLPRGLAGHLRKASQSASDLETVGSWQLLDSSDFYSESSSSHSPACRSSSAGSRGSSRRSRCRSGPASAAHSCHTEPTARRTRLEQVRTHFYDAYRTVVGIGTPPGAQAATAGAAAGQAGGRRPDAPSPQRDGGGGGGSGISSLLGYLAGKVSSRK